MGCVVSNSLDCDLFLLDGNTFKNNTSTNFGAAIAYYLKPHQDPGETSIYINNTSSGRSYNTASYIFDFIGKFDAQGTEDHSGVKTMALPTNLEDIVENYMDYFTSKNYEFEV